METKIEYRVRPVTRYIVTRYEQERDPSGALGSTGKSTQRGEYDTRETAYAVGYALCKAEHERLGWPVGDERIRYPSDLCPARGINPVDLEWLAVAPADAADQLSCVVKLPDDNAFRDHVAWCGLANLATERPGQTPAGYTVTTTEDERTITVYWRKP